MGTKKTSTCLLKAKEDEPIFVLRAQDLSAPCLIEFWVKMNPQISDAKRDDALKVAHEMREYQRDHPAKKAD